MTAIEWAYQYGKANALFQNKCDKVRARLEDGDSMPLCDKMALKDAFTVVTPEMDSAYREGFNWYVKA